MIIKEVLGEKSFAAKGSMFFLGFFLSISLSKYWFWIKIAEVMQENTMATTMISGIFGIPNIKVPTPKMASHPIQLRILSKLTKPWTLDNNCISSSN